MQYTCNNLCSDFSDFPYFTLNNLSYMARLFTTFGTFSLSPRFGTFMKCHDKFCVPKGAVLVNAIPESIEKVALRFILKKKLLHFFISPRV